MKKGCLYFHQGWTDIVCQLPLINYYRTIYDELNVIMRKDAAELLNFYIRNLTGITPQYINLNGGYNVPPNYDVLFHGLLDVQRSDKYANKFVEYCQDLTRYTIFIEGFYVPYDISHDVRIEYFNVDRDINLETMMYEQFVKAHGEKYIIYHDDPTNNSGIATKIEFTQQLTIPRINLHKTSTTFFDYLRIIYNAQEVHLIDSVWAALCYQMDAKYGIFDGKPINLYPKRGHHLMFTLPKRLKNWNII